MYSWKLIAILLYSTGGGISPEEKERNRLKYLRRRLRLYLPAVNLGLDTRVRRINVPFDFQPDTLPIKARPYWRELVQEYGYVAQTFLS
ncbi:hypothetical protein K3G63_11060 [Hymenobacter sp. HSC-4F20]|uniref:hypothetical protein n=1 Tax=Hymenobacter sp. HSC-4F20 TaxID=2864135 RepID=UPI001C73788D|nr:hypothetical protein [Hymenobacter sp. HSC-4F20]MBX0290982.1 hypothetical protein [Hymenobacter sp. HSC-4F20]